MKAILGSVMIILMLSASAEACVTCGNPRHNITIAPITSQWQGQTQGQFQGQTLKDSGNVNAPMTNSISGIGNPVMTFEAVPDFPMTYVPIPAQPLQYNGPFEKSMYADDQIWFNRLKWVKDMIENLPKGGKVTAAIYEKTQPVTYIQPRGKNEPRKGIWVGNVYCKSDGPDDNPGTVWGGCARMLLEKGCTFAYQIAGAITYGARSKALNQSGGVSLAGIFGRLFGFNAGAGASNTDHDASGYEIISLTWACYN